MASKVSSLTKALLDSARSIQNETKKKSWFDALPEDDRTAVRDAVYAERNASSMSHLARAIIKAYDLNLKVKTVTETLRAIQHKAEDA